MASKVYTINGQKFKAPSEKEARKLYDELQREKKSSSKSSGSSKSSSSKSSKESKVSVEDILRKSNLPDDQKAMIREVYKTVSSNDKNAAAKLASSIEKAMKFSDPYFKAQSRLVVDSLERGLQEIDDDLEFNEKSLDRALKDLRADVDAGKGNLSAEQAQELKALERRYTVDLTDTRDQLASAGMTLSSTRARKEQLLNESYGDIRESTNRSFTARQDELTNALSRGQRDTVTKIARLQELAKQGRFDQLARAEEMLGTNKLKDLGGLTRGYNFIGGLPGELERQKAKDALGFATQYIF